MNFVVRSWYYWFMVINPGVNFLLSLDHHPKTDLANSYINNSDFIILALHFCGPFGLSELRELSKLWRGDTRLGTYFGPTYGFTGNNFTSGTNDLYHQGGLASGGCRTLPPWYRSVHSVPGKTRYRNALTMDGMRRLALLLTKVPSEFR